MISNQKYIIIVKKETILTYLLLLKKMVYSSYPYLNLKTGDILKVEFEFVENL